MISIGKIVRNIISYIAPVCLSVCSCLSVNSEFSPQHFQDNLSLCTYVNRVTFIYTYTHIHIYMFISSYLISIIYHLHVYMYTCIHCMYASIIQQY